MIKIYKQLWYVVTTDKQYRDDRLAYMTYYEDNKQFLDRCYTGSSWADYDTDYHNKEKNVEYGTIIDNSPQVGFEVVQSVARWSTSNKLFRILDPRDFIVEIPTDNLAMLLKYTTVINGVIQEPCVWGREGSNHILIPVGSPPYEKALMDTKRKKSKYDVEYLSPGDIVEGMDRTATYLFFGKCRLSFENQRTGQIVRDKKWDWLFIRQFKDGTFASGFTTLNTVKPKRVVGNFKVDEMLETLKNHKVPSYSMPTRVTNKLNEDELGVYELDRNRYWARERFVRDTFRISNIEMKK